MEEASAEVAVEVIRAANVCKCRERVCCGAVWGGVLSAWGEGAFVRAPLGQQTLVTLRSGTRLRPWRSVQSLESGLVCLRTVWHQLFVAAFPPHVRTDFVPLQKRLGICCSVGTAFFPHQLSMVHVTCSPDSTASPCPLSSYITALHTCW